MVAVSRDVGGRAAAGAVLSDGLDGGEQAEELGEDGGGDSQDLLLEVSWTIKDLCMDARWGGGSTGADVWAG